ncbi:MAG: carotenoid biosynthesis protein, partial [Sphingobacteriales bacterium]
MEKRFRVATAIAVLFHTIGLCGMLFYDKALLARATPFNLLLMFALLLYTQQRPHKHFIILILVCFATGFTVEMLGTSTGWLFGDYAYGPSLGFSIQEVPLIIGVNWFIIIFSCGTSINMVLTRIVRRITPDDIPKPTLQAMSVIVDGATLAVLFDWLMEPVAVKLDYWKWLGSGDIPLYNYFCWFVVS